MSDIMDFDVKNSGPINLTLHTKSAPLDVCVGSETILNCNIKVGRTWSVICTSIYIFTDKFYKFHVQS